jgi:murein DD-endopeptidase MepM/ murein hydrolase activator NlpD
VQNSPANRVPSHGTAAFGSAYAIDLVPVDDRGRSAPLSWRGLLGSEPPDGFVGFGRDVFAPVAGRVVLVHDGEVDHAAHRSPLTAVPYLLSQGRRAAAGAAGLAGNHVVIAIADAGPYVLVAHLQRGSVAVQPGRFVTVGQPVGRCGNSGNSTEPHVHLQVSDSTDWTTASGLPFAFARGDGPAWLPRNGDVVRG